MPLRSAAANTHFHLFYIYTARVWGNWAKVFFGWEGINNLNSCSCIVAEPERKGKENNNLRSDWAAIVYSTTTTQDFWSCVLHRDRYCYCYYSIIITTPSWKHYITRRWWPAGWVSGISIHSFSGHWQQEASKKVVRRAVRRHFLPRGVCERDRLTVTRVFRSSRHKFHNADGSFLIWSVSFLF